MSDITERERVKYEQLWEKCPEYRNFSPAEVLAPSFCKRVSPAKGERVIDFGCGVGRVAKLFLAHDLNVDLVDFAPNALDREIDLLLQMVPERIAFWEASLWELPKELPQAVWGICCDVLEHIPEEMIEAVLEAMASRIQKCLFAGISLGKDRFGEVIGEELHVTVKSREWWLERLEKFWEVKEITERGGDLYLCCDLWKKEW